MAAVVAEDKVLGFDRCKYGGCVCFLPKISMCGSGKDALFEFGQDRFFETADLAHGFIKRSV